MIRAGRDMKKFLTVLLMFATIVVAGCGNKQIIETNAILLKESFWVADSENMQYLKRQ